MAFQPVANVAQLQFMGRIDGQLTINDLYFQISGGGITPVNLQALIVAAGAWWLENVAPLLSNDWRAERVVGTDLGSETGARGETAVPAPGGVANESAPNNVAACVSLRTAQRGRSARGRNYIPGIPNSLISLNTLDTDFQADILAAYNGIVGAGTLLAGWQLVVVSRYTAGAPRVSGLAIPVVAVVFTSPYVRSMRSREIGHGA